MIKPDLSIAALTACFAKAMDGQNPGFLRKFEEQLKNCYYEIRDESDNIGAMETLNWTNDFINRLNR